MAVFKPSNFSPSLTEIDLDDNNTFEAQINTSGESVKAYKLSVLNNDGSDTLYNGAFTELSTPVKNKGTLEIEDISTSTTGMENLVNGKDYQWGLRVYNETAADQTANKQPNTLVCSGYLTGSTKYVTWVNLPDHGEDGVNKKIADDLVYDRYIEYTVNSADELVIGAHESDDKEKPDKYPFTQRKKIDWVTKELGTDEDYIKIETEYEFDYDYLDGQKFSIYKCASDHTVTSAFADPNTNINVSDYIVIYNSAQDAMEAFNAGDTPDVNNSSIVPAFGKKKITGYSSDTGEIRVYDAWDSAPTNGMVYRAFEQDVSTSVYNELFCSDLVYKAPAKTIYYGLTAPTGTFCYSSTVNSGTTYYDASGTNAGTLSSITSCQLTTQGPINGSSSVQRSTIKLTSYTPNDESPVYDKTVGKVKYYSDMTLETEVGTLTADSTACTFVTEEVSMIVVENKTYYVETPNTLGKLNLDTTKTPYDKVTDCTWLFNSYSSVTFTRHISDDDEKSYTCYIKSTDLTSTKNTYYVASVKAKELTEDCSCTYVNKEYSTVQVSAKTYQIVSIQEGIVGSGNEYVVNNVTGKGGTINVDGVNYQVAFENLACYLDDVQIANPYEAQVIGGRPIDSTYYTNVNNAWNDTTKRLFIQPNINIKTDAIMSDEIIFDASGTRLKIKQETKINPSNNKEIDITFNKLDDSQWLIEGDNLEIVSGTVPTIPQTDYKVYTCFMDAAPLNLFYARQTPDIKINCRNYYSAKYNKITFTNPYYVPAGSLYYYNSKLTAITDGYDNIYIPVGTAYYSDPSLAEDYFVGNLTSAATGTYHTDYTQINDTSYYIKSPTFKVPENQALDSWTTEDKVKKITVDKQDRWVNSDYTNHNECVVRENPNEYMPMPSDLYMNDNDISVYDYKDMEFKSEVEYYSSTQQVKYYKYELYSVNNDKDTLVSSSGEIYSSDIEWHFRGLDSGSSFLVPQQYKIVVSVTDSNSNTVSEEQTFGIYYETDSDIHLLDAAYDCHEKGITITVFEPSEAVTTAYTDSAGSTYSSVTNSDIQIASEDVSYMNVPENKVLNYTNKNDESNTELYIPSVCSMLTQFQISSDFISNIPNYGESAIFSFNHEYTSTEINNCLTSAISKFDNDGNNNIKYNLGSFTARVTVDEDDYGSTSLIPYNGLFTITDSEGGTTYYYIIHSNKILSSGTVYNDAEIKSYINKCFESTESDEAITIEDVIKNDSEKEKLFTSVSKISAASEYNKTTEDQIDALMKEFVDRMYYACSSYNINEAYMQTYTLTMSDIMTYHLVNDSTGYHYIKNNNVGNLHLYLNDIQTPLTCFNLKSALLDYYSMSDNVGTEYITARTLKFALQDSSTTVICENPTTVVNPSTGVNYISTVGTTFYPTGVWNYTGSIQTPWVRNTDYEYIVIQNSDELPESEPTNFAPDSVRQVDSATGKVTYIWVDKDNIYIKNDFSELQTALENYDSLWLTLYMNVNYNNDDPINCTIEVNKGGIVNE